MSRRQRWESPNSPAPAADPGVVHQHGDFAEGAVGEVPQSLDFDEAADVDGKRVEHQI